MRRLFPVLAVLLALSFGLVPSTWAQGNEGRKPLIRRGFYGPQLAAMSDQSLVMLWARPVSAGHDLYIARRNPDGSYGDPILLNDIRGSVRTAPNDEARPAIATGPKGTVAAAWFARDGQLRVAISYDFSSTYSKPVTIQAAGARLGNEFAAIAFSADKSLYVGWLDTKNATKGTTEPAQLFAARVRDGRVDKVTKIGGDKAPKLCGCCRPALHIARGEANFLVRVLSDDGQRDVHQLKTNLDLDVAKLTRVGPPTLKAKDCNATGASFIGGEAIWNDVSKSEERIVMGTGPDSPLLVIAKALQGRSNSPRAVAGSKDLMLVPGTPHGQLLYRDGPRWKTVVSDLPAWCKSIAWVEGELLLIGDEHGELRMEAFDPTW